MKLFRVFTVAFLLVGLSSVAFAEDSKYKKESHEWMESTDTNKDGMISRVEFMKSKETSFDTYDANRNGMLDSSEMREMKEKKSHGYSDTHSKSDSMKNRSGSQTGTHSGM